ncbi:MAG: 2-amino-4-hydroxy-6-hydroxymethyldihydropteridine diphosphokinase [Actinomycetota bacterium]
MADDRILLRGLRVMAFCGVLPEEQARRQPFEINADVVTDMSPAGRSDDLEDTIDYGALTDRLADLVADGRFALLEYFSQRIADVLLADPRVIEVSVEVLKLRPPVPHDLAASGARVVRRRSNLRASAPRRVLLGLGSNLGERVEHLRAAVAAMPDLVAVSDAYETDPIGGPDQHPFLNLVVELRTHSSARELLELCRQLETDADRVRVVRWGPRTLDVDVLWIDGETATDPDLVVPHPRMGDRAFVMVPLAEVAPDLVDGWTDPATGDVRRLGPLADL